MYLNFVHASIALFTSELKLPFQRNLWWCKYWYEWSASIKYKASDIACLHSIKTWTHSHSHKTRSLWIEDERDQRNICHLMHQTSVTLTSTHYNMIFYLFPDKSLKASWLWLICICQISQNHEVINLFFLLPPSYDIPK